MIEEVSKRLIASTDGDMDKMVDLNQDGCSTTLALIKPDAVEAGKVEEIISKIKATGLVLVAHKQFHLSNEAASSFYEEHKEKVFFNDLISFMTR